MQAYVCALNQKPTCYQSHIKTVPLSPQNAFATHVNTLDGATPVCYATAKGFANTSGGARCAQIVEGVKCVSIGADANAAWSVKAPRSASTTAADTNAPYALLSATLWKRPAELLHERCA